MQGRKVRPMFGVGMLDTHFGVVFIVNYREHAKHRNRSPQYDNE